MKRLPLLVLALAAAGAVHAQRALPGFGWFGTLAGSCWAGQFPDGKLRHTQCYTLQFDQFIRGTAVLTVDTDGRTAKQFEGDSVFAWDESGKRIVYYIWGSDGNHDRLEARYEGDELVFPVPSRKDPSRIAFRSVWRRTGDDAFEVRRERPGANGWSTELTVVYRRTASGNRSPAN